jgi:hypothetical protein
MYKNRTFYGILLLSFIICLAAVPLYGKNDKLPPKEFGIYMMTGGGLKRIIPNVVFDENGILYVESNNPQRFALKDVNYLVVYGKHDMQVLTVNPLLFIQASRLGKPRYGFGNNVEFETKKKGSDLYTVKPKGLLGRGYFCLWINDTAWDFIIE